LLKVDKLIVEIENMERGTRHYLPLGSRHQVR